MVATEGVFETPDVLEPAEDEIMGRACYDRTDEKNVGLMPTVPCAAACQLWWIIKKEVDNRERVPVPHGYHAFWHLDEEYLPIYLACLCCLTQGSEKWCRCECEMLPASISITADRGGCCSSPPPGLTGRSLIYSGCSAREEWIINRAFDIAVLALTTCCENKWYCVQHHPRHCAFQEYYHFRGLSRIIHPGSPKDDCCPFKEYDISRILFEMATIEIRCRQSVSSGWAHYKEEYTRWTHELVGRWIEVSKERMATLNAENLLLLAGDLIHEATHAAGGDHVEGTDLPIPGKVNPWSTERCVVTMDIAAMLAFGGSMVMAGQGHVDPH